MQKNKFLIGIIALTIIALVGGIYMASKFEDAPQVEVNSEVKVKVVERSYDWGEIRIDGGNVEKVFNISNEGTEPLSLFNVITSCMCTTAQLVFDSKTSPVFGMHSESSYQLDVPPGETAYLKIIFDPGFHGPSGVGPIDRQIKVATNDPNKPMLNFMLTAVVRR